MLQGQCTSPIYIFNDAPLEDRRGRVIARKGAFPAAASVARSILRANDNDTLPEEEQFFLREGERRPEGEGKREAVEPSRSRFLASTGAGRADNACFPIFRSSTREGENAKRGTRHGIAYAIDSHRELFANYLR